MNTSNGSECQSSALAQAATTAIMQQVISDQMEKSITEAKDTNVSIKGGHSSIKKHEHSDDEISDGEIEELLNDAEFDKLRQKRLSELKKEFAERKNMFPGQYEEIVEQEFLNVVTKTKYVVCHFFHRDFERCKIVDKHLAIIAQNHPETKFIRINVEKAPFFVSKLVIRMLPTIVFFIDGIAVDRMVGFEDVGGVDDFKTEALERRIARSGVIETEEAKRELISQMKACINRGKRLR